jgi:dGTPase
LPLYTQKDYSRIFDENAKPHPYRSPFRKDFDRIIHSPAFRRLQGKTQLYPGLESDFFRNRLTHSLEVAQIAKSIAAKINYEHQLTGDNAIDPDVVEFAGLAHDLGHPPFGHQGEEMLDELMVEDGGYEGNAQTLRILTRLEKKIQVPGRNMTSIQDGIDGRVGLNLTARMLATVLKYDNVIPSSKKERLSVYGEISPVKGYYGFDQKLVSWIKECVTGERDYKHFKTVECQIMDLADDIAYSTYDLEDGLKAGFITLHDALFASEKVRQEIAWTINKKFEKGEIDAHLTKEDVDELLKELFARALNISKPASFEGIEVDENNFTQLAILFSNSLHVISRTYNDDGFARTYLTSKLVDQFMRGVQYKPSKKHSSQAKVYFDLETLKRVEVLKKFTYISQILSPRLKIVEYRGKEIVREIFECLADTSKDGYTLLPSDSRELYEAAGNDQGLKHRIICDFIAGMTDRYAIEFYGRLKSENPETIFKPF